MPGLLVSSVSSRCEAEQDTRNCDLKLGHFKIETLFTHYKTHHLNIQLSSCSTFINPFLTLKGNHIPLAIITQFSLP